MADQKFSGKPTSVSAPNGANILENSRTYFTEDNEYTFWKNISGHDLTIEELELLLEGISIGPFSLTKKDGSNFEAKFKFNSDTKKIEFEWVNSVASAKETGLILNNEEIFEDEKRYFTKTKGLNVRKEICGVVITLDNIKELIEDGITSTISGMVGKSGKSFDSKLKLKEDGSTEFVLSE